MIRPVWYQISHVSETPCNSHHQVRMILGESSPIEEHFFIQTHPRNKNYLCIKPVFVLMNSMYPISTTRKTCNDSNPSQNSCWNQKNPKDLNFSVQTQIHSDGSAPATSQMGLETILDFYEALDSKTINTLQQNLYTIANRNTMSIIY